MTVYLDPATGELVRDAAPFQLFPALDTATEAALRASIERFGVLVPVHRDQKGRTLDGHHRARIADELGVPYQVNIVVVADDEEAAAIARTLNADRRHLTAEQRREMVAALLSEVDDHGIGVHSPNAVADALGVSLDTVQRDASELTDVGKLAEPTHRRGQDGKVRPSKRPTQIAAKNQREAARAQDALVQLGGAVPTVPLLDVKRTERIARERAAEDRRNVPAEPIATPDGMDLRHGDFRQALADVRDAHAVITDPPYAQQYYHLYPELAAIASTILRPGGHLVVLCGTNPRAWLRLLDEMERHLPLRWVGCYSTAGPAWRDHTARVATGWKPLLVFRQPGDEPARSLNTDVFRSDGDDKAHHGWGQDVAGFRRIVEAFTEPRDLVVDPFLGGGTTAVACKQTGRRFVGCDIDQAHVATARGRVA